MQKGILRFVLRVFMSFAFIWFILSIFIYNFLCFLQDDCELINTLQLDVESIKIILIKLIKYVETPCILLSFMVYLLYEVVRYARYRKTSKHIKSI